MFCTKPKRCKQKRQNITLYAIIAMVRMVLTVTLCPLYLRAHTYTSIHTNTYENTYTLYAGAHSNAIAAKLAQMFNVVSIMRKYR